MTATFKAASAQPARNAEAIWPNVREVRMTEAKTLPENETPTLGTHDAGKRRQQVSGAGEGTKSPRLMQEATARG